MGECCNCYESIDLENEKHYLTPDGYCHEACFLEYAKEILVLGGNI